MASSNQLGIDTELRKLKAISPSHALKLVQILDENDSWKFLMSIVPKTLRENHEEASGEERKYNADHVRLVESAAKKDARTAGEIFLLEWSTSGRRRVTLGHLLELLQRAQLYRAADYVAMKILNVEAPSRPATGPAARVDILELDADLSDDSLSEEDANNERNVNEHPQVSNLTIENNLDNSKHQNSHRRANAGKFVVANEKTTQIADNRTTGSIPHGFQVDEGCRPEVNGIVLQSPPHSEIQSRNSHITRPELSRLLEITETKSSREINLSSGSNSSASNSDDNSLFDSINPQSSANQSQNSSVQVPCFSKLLPENSFKSKDDNESSVNASALTPTLSALLHPLNKESRELPNNSSSK